MEQNQAPQLEQVREVQLQNGEILVTAGERLVGLITVQTGSLKRYRLYQGQPFLAGIAAQRETIGLSELLEFAPVHSETLEAVGTTIVVIHPASEVTGWLKTAPPDLFEALQAAGSRRFDHQIRRPLELLPVRARVAATLWLLAERHGRFENKSSEPSVRVIDLDLTREEIAHLAGTVYESVIRTLTALKKEGVIDLRGRVIRILNENQLARIGQIAISESRGESNDQNTVSKNRNSSNNGCSKEAC